MLRSLIAIGVAGVTLCAALPAQAQYYPPPPPAGAYGYYYDDRQPPPRYYRERDYYQERDYGRRDYKERDGYYQQRGPQQYPPGFRGDPRSDPRQVMRDPRNGGTYCVFPGYTVQDGMCRPGR